MKIYYLSANPNLQLEEKFQKEEMGELFFIEAKGETEEKVVKMIGDAEIVLLTPNSIQKISEVFFEALPKLKYLIMMSVGFDGVDIKSAREHGVGVCNCPGVNAQAVAEYTWAMILTLSRKLFLARKSLTDQKEEKKYNLEGFEIRGKILGIIGTGEIGKRVAIMGKAFGAKTIGLNKSGRKVRGIDQIVSLDKLLKKSDIISINLPLNRETENFLGEKEINKMKNGVIMVNTSREKIVNKMAVIEGIQKGRIGAYGLDAIVDNNFSIDDPYLRYENILITRHSGYNTKEAKEMMVKMVIKNLMVCLSGKPINIVTL